MHYVVGSGVVYQVRRTLLLTCRVIDDLAAAILSYPILRPRARDKKSFSPSPPLSLLLLLPLPLPLLLSLASTVSPLLLLSSAVCLPPVWSIQRHRQPSLSFASRRPLSEEAQLRRKALRATGHCDGLQPPSCLPPPGLDSVCFGAWHSRAPSPPPAPSSSTATDPETFPGRRPPPSRRPPTAPMAPSSFPGSLVSSPATSSWPISERAP